MKVRWEQTAYLVGRPGWRLRVGDYRVIYSVADDVSIHEVDHRRDIYDD
jgi:mRNA interferase RelE/StbE